MDADMSPPNIRYKGKERSQLSVSFEGIRMNKPLLPLLILAGAVIAAF